MSEIIKGCLGFKGEKGEHGEVGTPIPFEGTFQELQNSEENRDRFYIIMDEQDEVYYKHWVYYDEKTEQWRDGGEYLANLVINLEDLTQEEWESLKSNLTNYYKRYESIYTTTQENEINIPINISQYNTLAILEVYIEGRMLNRNEYAINGTNSITLNIPLSEIGTKVHFIVYRSVCASNEDLNELKGPKGDSGAIVFNTIAEMKADEDLAVGDTCQLLTNDGDVELYKIINDDFSEYADDYNYVEIEENELYAVRIEQKRDKDIKKLQNKLNLHSIKENLMNFPLLVIKRYINGISGDDMSAQGMCATYNQDGTPDKIFLFGDYGTYSRLYIVNCGSTSTGNGWSYTYTDNVPSVHGSCLSYKDGYIYIGDNPDRSLVGTFTKYDIENDTYEYIDISNIVDTYINGIIWDDESKTFLVNANNNSTLYVLDENYNLIRSYSHNYIGQQNYVMQGYDYKYGYEFRTVSSGNSNLIFIFDTYTGNILKTIEVGYINGEIEDISINNGYALLYFNNFCNNINEIYMHAVTICYIGGSIENNMFSKMQQLIYTNYQFNNMGSKQLDNQCTLYYENNNNNDNIIRYCGTGSQENPFKSSLALNYFLSALSYTSSNFIVNLNINNSLNTDDNGLRIIGKNNINRLAVFGNNNSLNEIYCENIDLYLINISIISGNSRRDTGKITILRIKDLEIHGTVSCLYYDIQNSKIIPLDTGLVASSPTLQSILRRNIIVCNPSSIKATYINRYANLGDN